MHFYTLILLLLAAVASCFDLAPLLVASHRLVRGLKEELKETTVGFRHRGFEVTNMLKKLITACSSDEYLILDIPGLLYNDINDLLIENWPFLAKYLSLSSTTVGLSFVDDILDTEYIQEYVVNTCDAKVMVADTSDENSIDYIDSKTRVIRMQFAPLSSNPGERVHQIRNDDEFIRKIIRKLPSPHYTIILTSSTKLHVEPIPMSAFNSNPRRYGIFSSILRAAIRDKEVEFNDLYRTVEPHWNEARHSNKRYLENKKKTEVKFLDYDLWVKNEQLVMTLVVMILTVIMIKLKSLFDTVKAKLV